MTRHPKTIPAHNAALTGYGDFMQREENKRQGETSLRRVVAETIYRQLHGSLCLSEIALRDTVLLNIELALKEAGI